MCFWCLQFSQKTNENNSTWGTIVVKSNIFIRFLGELKVPKRHFEINWPLETLNNNDFFYNKQQLNYENRWEDYNIIRWNIKLVCTILNFLNSQFFFSYNWECILEHYQLFNLHYPWFLAMEVYLSLQELEFYIPNV